MLDTAYYLLAATSAQAGASTCVEASVAAADRVGPTRRQLDRWEPYVAAAVLRGFDRRQLDGADICAAELEHHFALIAARNLLRALELERAARVAVDPTMRAELIEGRDLHEHWVENLPVFNVTPRPEQPGYRSGRDFAARNPKDGPYDRLAWRNMTGAQLLPNVSAPGVA